MDDMTNEKKQSEQDVQNSTEASQESRDGQWRGKLSSRGERLKYLETAERYWYGKEWYGSEKRKKPA